MAEPVLTVELLDKGLALLKMRKDICLVLPPRDQWESLGPELWYPPMESWEGMLERGEAVCREKVDA